MRKQLTQLIRLVKETWHDVKTELGPSPPIACTDSGTHLALTANNFKYLDKVHFTISNLVQSCKESLQIETTQHDALTAAPSVPHADLLSECIRIGDKEMDDSQPHPASAVEFQTDIFNTAPQPATSSHEDSTVPLRGFITASETPDSTTRRGFEGGKFMPPMSDDDLDKTYGLGFGLLKQMGYSTGSAIGTTSREDAITTPIQGGTPQEALTAPRAIRENVTRLTLRHTRVNAPNVQTAKTTSGQLEEPQVATFLEMLSLHKHRRVHSVQGANMGWL